jgi:hypothetical protein
VSRVSCNLFRAWNREIKPMARIAEPTNQVFAELQEGRPEACNFLLEDSFEPEPACPKLLHECLMFPNMQIELLSP